MSQAVNKCRFQMGGRVGVVIQYRNQALDAHLVGCTSLEEARFTPWCSKGEIIPA